MCCWSKICLICLFTITQNQRLPKKVMDSCSFHIISINDYSVFFHLHLVNSPPFPPSVSVHFFHCRSAPSASAPSVGTPPSKQPRRPSPRRPPRLPRRRKERRWRKRWKSWRNIMRLGLVVGTFRFGEGHGNVQISYRHVC